MSACEGTSYRRQEDEQTSFWDHEAEEEYHRQDMKLVYDMLDEISIHDGGEYLRESSRIFTPLDNELDNAAEFISYDLDGAEDFYDEDENNATDQEVEHSKPEAAKEETEVRKRQKMILNTTRKQQGHPHRSQEHGEEGLENQVSQKQHPPTPPKQSSSAIDENVAPRQEELEPQRALSQTHCTQQPLHNASQEHSHDPPPYSNSPHRSSQEKYETASPSRDEPKNPDLYTIPEIISSGESDQRTVVDPEKLISSFMPTASADNSRLRAGLSQAAIVVRSILSQLSTSLEENRELKVKYSRSNSLLYSAQERASDLSEELAFFKHCLSHFGPERTSGDQKKKIFTAEELEELVPSLQEFRGVALDHAASQNRKLSRLLKQMEEQHEELRSNLSYINNYGGEGAIANLKQEIARLNEYINVQYSVNQSKQQQAQAHIEEISNYASELRETVAKIDCEKKNAESAVKDYEKRWYDAEKRASGKERECNELEQKLKHAEEAIDYLKERRETNKKIIFQQSSELSSLREQLNVFTTSSYTVPERKSEDEQKKKAVSSGEQLEASNEKVQAKDREIARLREELQKERSERSRLEHSMARENEDAEKQIEQWKQRSSYLLQVCKSLENTKDATATSYVPDSSVVSLLNDSFERFEDVFSTVSDRVQQLWKRLQRAQDRLAYVKKTAGTQRDAQKNNAKAKKSIYTSECRRKAFTSADEWAKNRVLRFAQDVYSSRQSSLNSSRNSQSPRESQIEETAHDSILSQKENVPNTYERSLNESGEIDDVLNMLENALTNTDSNEQ